MSQATNTDLTGGHPIGDVVGPLVDGQTYRNLLYLLLAFPLGIAYYVILITGFALGIGLSVLLVGLGILLVTVIGLRFIAAFERRLANALLGTSIASPDDLETDGDGIVETAMSYVQAASTWRGFGFVLLKFWIGVLSFVLLVSFLGTAIELLLLPVIPDGVLNVQVAGWEVADSFATTTQRAVAVPVGAVLAVVAVHVLNAFAGVNASITASLLGPDQVATDGEPSSDRST